METNSDLLSANVPGEVRIKVLMIYFRPFAPSPALLRSLWIQGPCVFKLYRNRPVDTAEAFDENGWFKTGDVAERTEDGYYKILGRNSSDIIKVTFCSDYTCRSIIMFIKELWLQDFCS